jgi:hypothetical protein
MRTPPTSQTVGAAETASFAGLVHRPLLILGNGPSAARLPWDRLPANPVIFRLNWFFLEDAYLAGHQVDAWFAAVANPTMEEMLDRAIGFGRYQVDRLCTPMRFAPASPLNRVAAEQLDCWAALATNPRLARHCMSRPGLPTTGLQAVGFALAVGFQEIYLGGMDLYEGDGPRYAWPHVPHQVKAALERKDLQPGYEPAHSRDTDLAFLTACLAEYPQAKVYTVSGSTALAALLPAPPASSVPSVSDAAGSPPVAQVSDAVGSPWSRAATPGLASAGPYEAGAIDGPAGRLPYADLDGRRCAYVTLVAGPGYHHGALALANSLAKVSQVPLIALVTPDANRDALARAGLFTAQVDAIGNPHLGAQPVQSRFGAVFTKLHAWRLDYLDRLVFLDADTVVLRGIDELFLGQGFAAAPDWGLKIDPAAGFNSGVFATQPSRDLFLALLDQSRHDPSPDGGDQGFLNRFFPGWQRLDPTFNVLTRIYTHHPELFRRQDVRVLHYVGAKPWQFHDRAVPGDELERLWLAQLTPEQLLDLAEDLRLRGAGVAGDTARAATWLARSRAAARQARFGEARRWRRAALALGRGTEAGSMGAGVGAAQAAPRWDRWPAKAVPAMVLRPAYRLYRKVRRGFTR